VLRRVASGLLQGCFRRISLLDIRGGFVTTTTLFKSNRTQAVRLPKDVAFPDGVTEVEIVVVGNSRIISPKGKRWDAYFAQDSRPSEDFLTDRDQGVFDEREPL
jgi:antitoxin VapB